MQSQLDNIRQEFDAQTERVNQLNRRFSKEDWLRKPSAEGWSAIECVEHLNLTGQRMIPKLTAAIASANSQNRDKKFRLDLFGWLLVKTLSSRGRLSKSKTPAPFIPVSGPVISKTLEQFRENQARLLKLLRDARGKAIDHVKVQSLFHDNVRYHVYSSFRILAVHEARHLDQAERAAKAI